MDDFRGVVKQRHGFVCDPDKPLWHNVEDQLQLADINELRARPQNSACHNLLKKSPLSSGTPQLLGLGLNFCVKPGLTKEMTKGTFSRLENDIRRIHHLRDAEESGDYNPKLYLKSDYLFKDAPKRIERGISDFAAAIERHKAAPATNSEKKLGPISHL